MKNGTRKGGLAAALMALIILVGGLPARAEESRFGQPGFDVPCTAAVLMEQTTGTVLYAKDPDIQLPMASITKVMTLLLTMEAVESGRVSKEDIVPVTAHAYSMGGSQIWLEPGEQFTLDEMLRAICVASANDAAVAVAEYIGGSEGAFVERMNARAAELEMVNTHYENACGLDAPGHVSSARDVAMLSREMLNNHPDITEYTTIWSDSLRGGATQLVNTNKLLRQYQGITGLKTGTTGKAGVCITASATRDGLSLIAVVLGATTSQDRFDAAAALLDYGFGNFAAVQPPQPENAPEALPVKKGVEAQAGLIYGTPGTLLLRREEAQEIAAVTELPEALEAPVEPGQQVGNVVYRAGESEVGRCGIFAETEVPRLDFPAALRKIAEALVSG